MPKPVITITYQPPQHGWLLLQLTVNDQVVEIDASDVPHNPVEGLICALASSAQGTPASVWWHSEPDGYFLNFNPTGGDVELSVDFAFDSNRARAQTVLKAKGSREQILMPFWRFLRQFQSHGYSEPHWPQTDYSAMDVIKADIRR
jgi:hypothetical protein